MYRPYSVPATSRPLRLGSSRMTRVKACGGMPFTIFFQVLPKSVVLYRYGRKSSDLYMVAATYAVPASCGEASMELIWIHSGMSLGVTFCQVLPASRVTWTRPSSEPVQITPLVTGDSIRVKMVQ